MRAEENARKDRDNNGGQVPSMLIPHGSFLRQGNSRRHLANAYRRKREQGELELLACGSSLTPSSKQSRTTHKSTLSGQNVFFPNAAKLFGCGLLLGDIPTPICSSSPFPIELGMVSPPPTATGSSGAGREGSGVAHSSGRSLGACTQAPATRVGWGRNTTAGRSTPTASAWRCLCCSHNTGRGWLIPGQRASRLPGRTRLVPQTQQTKDHVYLGCNFSAGTVTCPHPPPQKNMKKIQLTFQKSRPSRTDWTSWLELSFRKTLHKVGSTIC